VTFIIYIVCPFVVRKSILTDDVLFMIRVIYNCCNIISISLTKIDMLIHLKKNEIVLFYLCYVIAVITLP